MRPEALRHSRRVVVVRLDNLGDVVLTAPFARALRSAAPSATITLLASPAGAAAAPLLPWYDEVVTTRAVWQDLGGRMPLDPPRERAFIDRLANGRYDAAFICTSFSQTSWPPAYAAYLAGVPIRVGHAPDFGGSVLSDPVVPPPSGTHQAERNLALLDAVGVNVDDRSPTIVVPEEAVDWADARLADTPGEAVAIAPGASCAARRWHADRYGQVARGLAAAGRPVLVLGTERERALAEPILEVCPSAISLVGETSASQLAAVIERSALVVCGNSAALHLADAVGTPIVALFSGTDLESEWRPRRAPAALLRVRTPCAPCRLFDCPIGLACLDIAPEVVLAAANDLLAERPPSQPRVEEPCAVSAS